MRQCPLCLKTYEDGTGFCPQDGRVLLPPDPLLGQVIDSKYRIEALLGGGGQGNVYRALHLLLERTTALKFIRSDSLTNAAALERFRNEAQALAQLRHPNIVTVHDFGAAREVGFYIVMEHLRGHSLADEIMQQGRLPEALARDVMRQTCEGVRAAHSEGILHCDLKPDNIFMETGSGGSLVVKIVDFGVARLQRRSPDGIDSEEAPGALFGTPAYMAPELFSGSPHQPQADVYALGCVLYEILTGRPPFGGRRISEVARKHMIEDPTPPTRYVPSLTPAFDAVISRALAKQPTQRFASAEELAGALDKITPGAPLPAVEVSTGSWPPSDSSDLEDTSDDRPTIEAAVGLVSNNLPSELSTFVGRDEEILELRGLVGKRRLVTLLGPGGCGKTRLSLKVASDMFGGFADGVWLIEIAPVSSPGLVEKAVAAVLGVTERAGQSLFDAIVERLRAKRILLLVDNCEHIIQACATLIGGLLRACPRLHILATSQEALGVPGEATYTVRPLALPETASGGASEAGKSEAVRLFVERATLGNTRFRLTDDNAMQVVEICRRLDGIPLAIELAASRVRMLSLHQIAARLDDRFQLLGSVSRGRDQRQSTLRSAIDWSYDLLNESERVIFNRLSVFAAGFDLEAAEGVCGLPSLASGEHAGSEELTHDSPTTEVQIVGRDVFEMLSRLVDKSLVNFEEGETSVRYRMLETIRHYGAEKLRESGEASAVRSAHRDYFLELAERAELELEGPEQVEWLNLLAVEHDNLRNALEWCKSDAGTSDAFTRLVAALGKFWLVRHHASEGIGWADAALQSYSGKTIPRAKALAATAELMRIRGDYETALAYLHEAMSIFAEAGDKSAIARTLNRIGVIEQWRGDLDRAASVHEQALSMSREARDEGQTACALNNLGVLALFRGEDAEAEERIAAGLELFRKLGDRREVASALNNLGVLAGRRGSFHAAAALGDEHLALRRELGDRQGVAIALNNLAQTLLRRGELGRAGKLLLESLSLYATMGDRRGIAYLLETLCDLLVLAERPGRALKVAGAAASLRLSIRSPLSRNEELELDRVLQPAWDALGAEESSSVYEAGQALRLEEILSYATAAVEGAGHETPRG